jgi:hypothetical protein
MAIDRDLLLDQDLIIPLKWRILARPVVITSFGINLNTQIFRHDGISFVIHYCLQRDQPNSVLAMRVARYNAGQPFYRRCD